jgi:Cu/Zn superoxide dismutase
MTDAVRRIALPLLLIVASACNPFRQQTPVEISASDTASGSRWNATLATPSALTGALDIRGTAWMAPSAGRTLAGVSISNAAPGGVHPWHIHEGRCGGNGAILGPPGAYPPLKVATDGTARAQANLDIPLPQSGQYYVNVHASSDNMGTIIACGNLAPPVR